MENDDALGKALAEFWIKRRETSAAKPRASRLRSGAMKGRRTQKRMAKARAREQERRDDEFTAEHGLMRPLR